MRLLLLLAACSSSKPGTDPAIEEPIVVDDKNVGRAMHTQAVRYVEYDAWCKEKPELPCSRAKRTGDEPHVAEVFRRGSEVVVAINTMGGAAVAATPIRFAGEPDSFDLAVTRIEGGIPLWEALLTIHQGKTWYAQDCGWSGDGCTLPVVSQTAAPTLDRSHLVVRGASLVHDGKLLPLTDGSYVMFVP